MKGIYKILSPTGKVYIGQSVSVETRISKYKTAKCKSQTKLYNSIIKHGWGNHTFEVLHELPIDVSRDVLDKYERVYIELFINCGVELLNIREGGYTGRLNNESISKMSEKRKGENNSMYGKTHSEEVKKRISNLLIGRFSGDKNPMYGKKGQLSPNFGKPSKKGRDNPLYGIPRSVEVIEKMRATQIKNKRVGSDNPRYGVKFSDDHKKKISLSLAGHVGNNNRQIIQETKDGTVVKHYSSIVEASCKTSIQKSDINKCCRNVIKTAGGFIWKYKTTPYAL